MNKKILRTYTAIDALVDMQDEGYGTPAISEVLGQLNRLVRKLEEMEADGDLV